MLRRNFIASLALLPILPPLVNHNKESKYYSVKINLDTESNIGYVINGKIPEKIIYGEMVKISIPLCGRK